MKIYFAGPLFTPYVRQFISEHAQILRENGINPFVPHEQPFAVITPERVETLLQQGLISPAELDGKHAEETVMEMVRTGRLSREQVGLPPVSAEHVFDVDYGGLASANAVVALLDGTQVDDGTACEIGIFYTLTLQDPAHKKGIVGLMTDSRGLRKKDRGYGLNYFVLGILEETGQIYDNIQDVIQHLKTWDAELNAN